MKGCRHRLMGLRRQLWLRVGLFSMDPSSCPFWGGLHSQVSLLEFSAMDQNHLLRFLHTPFRAKTDELNLRFLDSGLGRLHRMRAPTGCIQTKAHFMPPVGCTYTQNVPLWWMLTMVHSEFHLAKFTDLGRLSPGHSSFLSHSWTADSMHLLTTVLTYHQLLH